ncbi:response regulator [Sphingobacteriaceae bacterium WQ 2009]|uniref:Response regulator n=1 Tax=Rhinopithecimicrobium faecis TaxID=2820698 RepID=A0A8T4HGI3_9SPHI|nr:response regulator [Sphingobacteriaceae bacterium WQ 2009]
MIKTLIIDDEPLARSILLGYLKKDPDIQVLAECGDGFEAMKAIQQHQPDLLFLDIQMPKLSGFELLELIDQPVGVIFTTAFDEYALKAFEKNAVDYLLKPIAPQRFENALHKFKQQFALGKAANPTLTLSQPLDEKSYLERIVVKNGSEIKIIPISSIRFLEAYDDYVKIHCQEGMYLKNKTMAYFEKNLDPKLFVRVHRSYLLKIDQLAKMELYEKDAYIGSLITGEKISISKSGYSRLKQIIGL